MPCLNVKHFERENLISLQAIYEHFNIGFDKGLFIKARCTISESQKKEFNV